MNDDSHFMRSLSVEMASHGRGYYSKRSLEIAETIERLLAENARLQGIIDKAFANLDAALAAPVDEQSARSDGK